MDMGTVFWITGLSGAGKTTIGRIFYETLKKEQSATVFLDGDALRQVFGGDLGYSADDRRKCAMRYSRLCCLLQGQGINVICCTISMYDSVRKWNRENIPDYKEVYIKVSMDTLQQRNQKGLYSSAANGADHEVAGVQVEIEFPQNPDLIIENEGKETPEEQAQKIWRLFLEEQGL